MKRIWSNPALVVPLVLLSLAVAQIAFADAVTPGSGSVTLTNPLGDSCSDLSCPAAKVANFLFTIAVPLAGIMILVGGFQMMTAAGDPEKFGKGRKTLLYAVIGFTVVIIAGSVATLIQQTFGGS